MRRALPWLLLLATGCAENAILELDIVPPEAGTATLLNVQVLSSDEELDAPQDLGSGTERFVLGNDPTHLHVVADGPEIERPLLIGVWTCAGETCSDEEQGPTQLLRVERAFYLGEYTHLDLNLRGRPLTGVVEVSRCAVQGCGIADTSYCWDDGGVQRHYCER